jgi:ATP-dependent RNA helicase DDX6/DHH1
LINTTALILVPTRELALQTSAVCKELGKHMNVQVMVTTGGTPLTDDIIRLQQPVHILVGTPGRVLDLASTKNLADLSKCRMIALDEADKLLSAEFQCVAENLIMLLPRDRQILMFSATFPVTVKSFRDKWLRSPYEINLVCGFCFFFLLFCFFFLQKNKQKTDTHTHKPIVAFIN